MYNKVIVIDWSIILHKAVFSLKFNPTIPVTYTALNILIGLLYRLNLEPDDLIILAGDGRNSWRKDFETSYKSDRKQKRIDSGIDWEKCFSQLGKLLDDLNNGLNLHVVKLDRIEADDIAAVCCRCYKESEIILVSHDKDWEICFAYDNVKIFSTLTKKWKIKSPNFDVVRLISEKIYKEATDGLTAPILNEEDYEKRHLCVNLLQLPEWVELKILDELNKIQPKKDNVYSIPFKSLQIRYSNLYNDKSKVILYNDQVAKTELKEVRLKKKKEDAKAKEKRLKEKELKLINKLEQDNIKLTKKLAKLEKKNEERDYDKVTQNC